MDHEPKKSDIIFAQSLDEATLLDAIQKGVLKGQIEGLIAQTAVMLDVPMGTELVLPVAGVIKRNQRAEGWKGRSEDHFVRLMQDLKEASRSYEKIEKGLALGDRALHDAAGFPTSPKKRDTRRDQIDGFVKGMACTGYSAALNAAEGTARAKSVELTIMPLLLRLNDAVRILAFLIRRRVKKAMMQ